IAVAPYLRIWTLPASSPGNEHRTPATSGIPPSPPTQVRFGCPVSGRELEREMFESVNVIGRGRVGSAVAARLEERGVELREDGELVLLCVPDAAIADVCQGLSLGHGQWIAHVSGATALRALDPHTRRLGLHPLAPFT